MILGSCAHVLAGIDNTQVAELQKKIEDIFLDFDDKPFASASIAQVHKAKLKDGTIVVLKVRRPDILEKIELDIIRWSEKRRIIPNSTPFAQAMKAVEEINELVDALREDKREDAIDAVGDTVVCLINVCALMDVNLVDCLEAAYQQIKDRKGYMNEQGIFVKQS